jgi:hypothetical protein
LISKGPDVNANDEKGCTPLHLASKGKYVDSHATKGSHRLDAMGFSTTLLTLWR